MASFGSALQHELDIGTKISNLEQKASKLECDFNEMLHAAQGIELEVKKYVKKAETEHKSMELVEKLTDADNNLADIMDHVRIFFNFILAKMKIQHADVTDVNMLWHLIDCDGVSRCFTDVILKCGFSLEDIENMKTLSAVVSRLQVDLESEVCSINLETESSLEYQDTEKQEVQSMDSDIANSGFVPFEKKLDEIDTVFGVNKEVIEKDNDVILAAPDPVCNDSPLSLSALKETGVPIRESLKKIKFVDIDEDMKTLIEKIVCYVAKIRFE